MPLTTRNAAHASYFGETRSHDCGQCDVCLSHIGDKAAEDRLAPAKERILRLLSDHQMHHITEINSIKLPSDILDQALEDLVNEEEIHIKDSFIHL